MTATKPAWWAPFAAHSAALEAEASREAARILVESPPKPGRDYLMTAAGHPTLTFGYMHRTNTRASWRVRTAVLRALAGRWKR